MHEHEHLVIDGVERRAFGNEHLCALYNIHYPYRSVRKIPLVYGKKNDLSDH